MTASAAIGAYSNEIQEALATDNAFDVWYRRTAPRVYAYLMRRCGQNDALADELLQETLIAAIDRRSQFEPGSDVVAWLCGIGRHKLADHYRRLEREERRRLQLEVREIQVGRPATTEPGLDERTAISEALQSLPAAQRAVLIFAVLDDRPITEVASLMHRSTLATQSLLHRARQGFKRAYRGEALDV